MSSGPKQCPSLFTALLWQKEKKIADDESQNALRAIRNTPRHSYLASSNISVYMANTCLFTNEEHELASSASAYGHHGLAQSHFLPSIWEHFLTEYFRYWDDKALHAPCQYITIFLYFKSCANTALVVYISF